MKVERERERETINYLIILLFLTNVNHVLQGKLQLKFKKQLLLTKITHVVSCQYNVHLLTNLMYMLQLMYYPVEYLSNTLLYKTMML